MRFKYGLILLFVLFSGGCVFVNIPGVGPLSEKVIGGQGAAKIAVLDISGLLIDEETSNIFGVETRQRLTARIKDELELAASDDAVKAVVFRINTPGGSVTTCDIINHEIKSFKKRKNVPIVAELMEVAASGGYYIASASDAIIAHPTTVTGSIGVIAYNVNASGLMEKIGLANQTLKSGDKKDIGSPIRPMTEEERRILQSVIDGLYERFLDVVVEGRRGILSRDEIIKAADGRIYSARQALELKLIDSIGYLDDALGYAMKAAGVEEARVVTYAAQRAYKSNIYSSADAPAPRGLSLININAGPVSRPGMNFMYLWMQ